MMPAPHMDIKEFTRLGFLQEVNRQFFHPRGMALEVTENDDGSEVISGVWDYRHDPEGVMFSDLTDDMSATKAINPAQELERHREAREKVFGAAIQPIGSKAPPDTPRGDLTNESEEDDLRATAGVPASPPAPSAQDG